MAGCTVRLLAFTMAMEVIIRASLWAGLAVTMAMEVIIRASQWAGGERLQDGTRSPPIQTYMGDTTTLTTTAPCTNRLLAKLNDDLKWARMKVKLNGCSI